MKRILLLFISLAAGWGAAAKIRLPEIIGNDMVLQQNAEVRLWGWAEPHAAVKVETSWGAGAAVKSDADGRWAVSVRTPAGSYEPQRITFASGDRVTFDRVLIGEVWFAGGQSNMEMPLGGFWQCPVTDANEIIARAGAKSGKLHYVKIPHAAAYTPQDRTAGSWTPCTTATAAKFTAAGYFFAEMLNDVLGVPVGIIDCSWGGSRVESWMSREVLSGYSDIDLTEEGISRVAQHLRPMVMYNAMLQKTGGDLYVGIMTVINTVREVISMPVQGITHSSQPVMGYNYGAKEYGRVKKAIVFVSAVSVLYTLGVWSLVHAFPEFFIRIFNRTGDLVEAGIPAMRIYFFGFFMMAFQFAGQAIFVGLGKAKNAVFFSIFRKVIIVIPLIIILPSMFHMGTDGILMAEPVSNFIGGTACFVTMLCTVWPELTKGERDKNK